MKENRKKWNNGKKYTVKKLNVKIAKKKIYKNRKRRIEFERKQGRKEGKEIRRRKKKGDLVIKIRKKRWKI